MINIPNDLSERNRMYLDRVWTKVWTMNDEFRRGLDNILYLPSRPIRADVDYMVYRLFSNLQMNRFQEFPELYLSTSEKRIRDELNSIRDEAKYSSYNITYPSGYDDLLMEILAEAAKELTPTKANQSSYDPREDATVIAFASMLTHVYNNRCVNKCTYEDVREFILSFNVVSEETFEDMIDTLAVLEPKSVEDFINRSPINIHYPKEMSVAMVETAKTFSEQDDNERLGITKIDDKNFFNDYQSFENVKAEAEEAISDMNVQSPEHNPNDNNVFCANMLATLSWRYHCEDLTYFDVKNLMSYVIYVLDNPETRRRYGLPEKPSLYEIACNIPNDKDNTDLSDLLHTADKKIDSHMYAYVIKDTASLMEQRFERQYGCKPLIREPEQEDQKQEYLDKIMAKFDHMVDTYDQSESGSGYFRENYWESNRSLILDTVEHLYDRRPIDNTHFSEYADAVRDILIHFFTRRLTGEDFEFLWDMILLLLEDPEEVLDYQKPVKYDQELSEHGDLMTLEEFQEDVECGALIDYDGHGYPVKDGKMSRDITISPEDLNSIPDDATHIMWINR